MTSPRRYILTLSCPDRVGVVAAVSALMAANDGWISEAHHHSERSQQRFFMRQEILADSPPLPRWKCCVSALSQLPVSLR